MAMTKKEQRARKVVHEALDLWLDRASALAKAKAAEPRDDGLIATLARSAVTGKSVFDYELEHYHEKAGLM